MKFLCRWLGHTWQDQKSWAVNGFVFLPQGHVPFNQTAVIWQCRVCREVLIVLDDKKPAPKTET